MLEVESPFKEFLNQYFKFIESKFDDRVNIFSSKDLRLRIVKDRNTKLYMDVSTKENPETPEDWIILSDLKSYMLNNDDYLKESDFKDVSLFFIQNYQKIVDLLKTKYPLTINALAERGNKRAEIKYGYKNQWALEEQQQEETKQKTKPWWKFWQTIAIELRLCVCAFALRKVDLLDALVTGLL